MQVICTDGTVFACQSFDLVEYGLVLYAEERPDDDDRYDHSPDQIGYVPHDRLWYVLPDGVVPNVTGVQPVAGPAPQAGHLELRGPRGDTDPEAGEVAPGHQPRSSHQ